MLKRIALVIFFTIVGFVCTVMVGYALVDMYVILRQVIFIRS